MKDGNVYDKRYLVEVRETFYFMLDHLLQPDGVEYKIWDSQVFQDPYRYRKQDTDRLNGMYEIYDLAIQQRIIILHEFDTEKEAELWIKLN